MHIEQLIDLYRKYDNEHSSAESIKNADVDEVFRVVLGMTAEQFQYQNLWWIFEKFNRDYYMLLAAKDFEHRCEIDTNTVVKDVFSYSADDYVAILLMVFWLCSQHPDPLSAPENLYCRKENTILSPQNITHFIEYYSCNYKELREHPLGKQLLYSKPFIKTQRHKLYLSVSMFLVAMIVGNGLYWLVRDYYLKHGSQKFVNAFGLIFEDYIKDLAANYFESSKRNILSVGAKKGADFVFDFGSLQMLIESKSSLLKLYAKQQVPNLKSADTFFNHTISEAYAQLNSSYAQINGKVDVPVIKIILLYDEFSNTAIIELSTNHERLSQPVMKIGYWLHYFFYFSSCLTIVLGRIKFDCTLEDLHPVCQRKCFALEHSILSHLLWLARVAKSVLSRANLLPILW